MLLPQSMSYVGPLAERSLDMYHVNKTFLSCKGVDPASGLSDSNEMQALLKKRMIEIADETILMADSSKFGTRAFSQIDRLHDRYRVITDSGIDKANLARLKDITENITIVG